MQITSPHTFHIPVMGIAYTIDSPIKVACFGINSAISVIEEMLPDTSILKEKYHEWLLTSNPEMKRILERFLLTQVVPGLLKFSAINFSGIFCLS